MQNPANITDRVNTILSRYRGDVIAGMRAALDRPGVEHLRYMRYHLGWEDERGAETDAGAGKMLRPAFCLLACEAVGGDARQALPAAVAIELLHNFTLVHDDIEDSSDLRHGRPTLWRVAGIPQAINAGDGLFVIAQRTLLDVREAGVSAERTLDAARILDEACVALCEGQYADIGFETRDRVTLAEYEAMIRGKTSALLGAAAAIGAIAGGADDAAVAAFHRCGEFLGLAFQIQDDVLGIWGESAATGKPIADDIRFRKKSFPIVYAFEHFSDADRTRLADIYSRDPLRDGDVADVLELFSRAEPDARSAAIVTAEHHADAAIAALAPLDLDADHRADLEALASFFVSRTA